MSLVHAAKTGTIDAGIPCPDYQPAFLSSLIEVLRLVAERFPWDRARHVVAASWRKAIEEGKVGVNDSGVKSNEVYRSRDRYGEGGAGRHTGAGGAHAGQLGGKDMGGAVRIAVVGREEGGGDIGAAGRIG